MPKKSFIPSLIAVLALSFPWTAMASVSPDTLIKASSPAVYYYANDGHRYVFPNEKTYHSWFPNFSSVVTITDDELAAIPLGPTNITYRPGIKMLKIMSDPQVYAVAPGGVLRPIASEAIAIDLYGQYWNTAIDDLPDALFVNYTVGDPITAPGDYDAKQVADSDTTIDADKHITPSLSPQVSGTEVDDQTVVWRTFAFNDLNTIRRENGIAPLIMNPLLNNIALIHSTDMGVNDHFDHLGTIGDTSDDRIRLGRVPDVATKTFITVPHPDNIDWTGENIGSGTMPNPEDTVEGTIQSIHQLFLNEPPDQPDHRTTMLSTLHAYSEVGIGLYVDAQKTLWLTEDYISH